MIICGTGYSKFQSTFPRGERRERSGESTGELGFQSTFPRGERREESVVPWFSLEFQSTFPRGERLHYKKHISPIFDFNPRSRVGNDVLYMFFVLQKMLFQSTFPRGERQQKRINFIYIFTHFCIN